MTGKKRPVHGSIQSNKGRYYYKVILPNTSERKTIALRCPGSKYATNNYNVAVELANQIYNEAKHSQSGVVSIETVGELITAWQKHIKDMYSNAPARIDRARYSLNLLDKTQLVQEFGPVCLIEIRNKQISKGLSILTINERINKIKDVFTWAASYEKIDPLIPHKLSTVKNLKESDCQDLGIKPAQERDPVDFEIVKITVKHTTPVVRDMVCLQLLTGARPSEILIMQAEYIDTSDEVWRFYPEQHKNKYRGHKRVITLGLTAQKILVNYMHKTGYLFTPEDSESERLKKIHTLRTTPDSCGNKPGSNKKGTRNFRSRWFHDSYRKAIEHACRKAFPAPEGVDKKEWDKQHRWTPYQLRHTSATHIREIMGDKGLDAVQAVLGHSQRKTSERYAKLASGLADEAIGKIDKAI